MSIPLVDADLLSDSFRKKKKKKKLQQKRFLKRSYTTNTVR